MNALLNNYSMDSLSEDDVLSLSPHSEWCDTPDHSGTDIDAGDWVLMDEADTDEHPDLTPSRAEGSTAVSTEDQDGAGLDVPPTLEDRQDSPSPSRAPGPVGDSGGMLNTRNKNRMRQCQVCGLSTREKIRRHMFKRHLPWYWSGTTACWDCGKQETQASTLSVRHSSEHRVGCFFDEDHLHQWCQLVNGALHSLKEWLNCPDLEGLLQFVIDRKLYTDVRSGFSEQEHQLVLFYVQNYSPDGLAVVTTNPPNHPGSLTNWELTAALLMQITEEQRTAFIDQMTYLTYEGSCITSPVPVPSDPFVFIDSHFHLDLILKRLHFSSFLGMSSKLAPEDSNNCFYYGVANYVFPKHWDSWVNQVGAAKNVFVSFGIHPHEAANGVTPKQISDVDHLAGNMKCVAIGEIGLDYTSRCRCSPCRTPSICQRRMMESQEKAFVDMLLIARKQQLPVILHCRDSGSGEAAARALQIIRDSFGDLRFHRHCFDGTLAELQEWQQLPNVVFGITGKFLREGMTTERIKMIARIKPQQLVLETDSPYLSPVSRNEVNHPWNLITVATEVCKIRNVPLSVLTWLTNDNALKFYRMRQPRVPQPGQEWGPRPL